MYPVDFASCPIDVIYMLVSKGIYSSMGQEAKLTGNWRANNSPWRVNDV
jgi:hypothetical protein